MSYQEIREFGSLVSAYRCELPVEEFCAQLQELYGESRKQLLKGTCGVRGGEVHDMPLHSSI